MPNFEGKLISTDKKITTAKGTIFFYLRLEKVTDITYLRRKKKKVKLFVTKASWKGEEEVVEEGKKPGT